jgi:hypothetical protein
VVVDRDAAGHRDKPRAQGRLTLRAEAVRVAPGTQQCLLHDVFGALPVAAGQSQHEHQERAGVLLVQLPNQSVVVVGGR